MLDSVDRPARPFEVDVNPPVLPSKPLKAFPSRYLRLAQRIVIRETQYPPRAWAIRGKMESFELLWVYDGTVEYAEGRRVGVDRLVLLRPGRRYIFSNDAGGRPARAVSIQFRIDVYPRAWGKPDGRPWECALPDGDICRPLIHYLLAQRKRRDPLVVRPALSALIAAFVSGQVQTVAPAVRPLPKPLLAALAFIHTELDKDPTRRFHLPEIAAAAGRGQSAITNYFRRHLGDTPMPCIMRARLDRAVHMMRRTDLPIEIIAVLTGFSNQAHLYVWCKRELGVNPQPLRKALCDGEHPMPAPRCPLLAGPMFGAITSYDPAETIIVPRLRRDDGFLLRLKKLVARSNIKRRRR